MNYIILSIIVSVIVIIGFWTFNYDKTILYENSFDFFLNCFIYVIPLVVALGIFVFYGESIDMIKFLIFELSGFTGILALNTYKNNKRIGTFITAFIIKILLALLSIIISILLIWIYIDRSGKDE